MTLLVGTLAEKVVLSINTKKILKFVSVLKLELLAIFLALIVSQAIFYFFAESQLMTTVNSIQSLANRDEYGSNLYKFAQVIENFETLNVLKCSKIFLPGTETPFIDTSFKANCVTHWVTMNGNKIDTVIKANSGQFWRLHSIVIHSFESQLIFWVMRILFVFVGLSFVMYLKWKVRELELKKDYEIARHEGMSMLARQVAHDIRSPLSALQTAVFCLKNDNEGNSKLELVDLLQQSAKRINDIANDLLNVEMPKDSSNNIYKLTKSVGEIDVKALADQIIKEKLLILEGKQVHFNITAPKDSITAIGHDREFCRILSNLINNSIEAMKNNLGNIHLKIEKREKFVLIQLVDNGLGIDPSTLEKIKLSPKSYGKESNSTSGYGIGLRHALKTVHSWGGKLYIDSVQGEGTTISIWLNVPQQNALQF